MAFNFKPAKQYGLLMPKKKESSLVKSNVFGDDSDEEDPHAAVNTDIKKQALQAKVKRQTQMQIDKALEQDPTVYDYDGVYDSLKAEKEEKNAAVKQKAEKKPRYIQGLMKAAEQRKREDERRQERKVQKEREKEGGEFDDKDVFITGAYRKKMQEMQELEEKERREAEMEALLDVKNQKDMTGFYRYLLRETTGEPQPGGTSEGGPQSGGTSGGDSQSGEITAGGIEIKQEKDDSETRIKEENSSSSEESEVEERNGSHKKDSHNHRSLKESRSNRDRSNSSERVRGEGHSRKDRKRSKSVDREKSHRRKDRSRSRDRNRERKRSRSKERDSDRHRYTGVSRDKSDKKHRRIEDEMDQSSRSKHDSRKRKSEDRDSKQEKNLKKRSIEEEHEEEEMILPQPPPSEEDSTKDEGVQKTNTGSEAKYSKKTSESDADAARRRYLERKMAKERARLAQQQQ